MGISANLLLISFINGLLILAGLAVMVLLVLVLIKLNKALTIWLAEKKGRD